MRRRSFSEGYITSLKRAEPAYLRRLIHVKFRFSKASSFGIAASVWNLLVVCLRRDKVINECSERHVLTGGILVDDGFEYESRVPPPAVEVVGKVGGRGGDHNAWLGA